MMEYDTSTYYELDLKINPMLEDVVSEYFFANFDCEGVVLYEETYKDLELVSSTEGTLRIFLKDVDKVDVEQALKNLKSELIGRGLSNSEISSFNYVLEKKINEDWSKKWKEKWDITCVTEKISVVPDWIEYEPKPDEVIIKLEPGCAFGTGTHQTTQLCMKALEKYLKFGDNVADIGMGSGILGILAKKLGAKFVYGCDNDKTVIDVAKENAVKNGLKLLEACHIIETNQESEEGKSTSCPPLESKECIDTFGNNPADGVYFELNTADNVKMEFDFVCANILHFVLAEIMGDLKNITKSGGYISLSGILDDKKQMVLDAIKREDLEIIEEIHQDQWTSFVVKKKES